MGLLNQIAVNSLYRFIFLLLQFLITILVSRLIGPQGLGSYSLILTNANILLIFTSLGVSSGIIFHAAKNDIRPGTLLKIALISAALQSALIMMVEYIHLSFSGSYWIWPVQQHLMGIAGILFFFSLVMTERYFALYNGNKLFTWYNIQLAFFSFLTIILLFYWILQPVHPAPNKVIMSIILIAILQMLSLAFFFPLIKKTKTTKIYLDPSRRNSFFTFSMLAYLANSIQFLVYRIDFWILNYFHGETELGFYALSVRIGQTLWILPGLLATIILPYITSTTFDKEVLEKILRVSTTFNLIVALIISLLSFIFIPFVFGPVFSESVTPLLILIPGIIIMALNILLAAYFAGMNRVRYNLKVSALSLITIVFLDFLLIPSMGKNGAALSSTIAYSVSGIYSLKLYANMENYPMARLLAGKSDIIWLRLNFRRMLTNNNIE